MSDKHSTSTDDDAFRASFEIPELAGAAPAVMNIRQIAVTVADVAAALPFYRDALGLKFLFKAGENLAFLDADGVRIMLTTPQGAGAVGANSILYFGVKDIETVHAGIVARGAAEERAPQLAANMPDHELWTSFVRDPDGNLIALMEER